MNQKVIIRAIGTLVLTNLLLCLSGIVVPWLISTNELPLAAIFVAISVILLAVGIVVCVMVEKCLS